MCGFELFLEGCLVPQLVLMSWGSSSCLGFPNLIIVDGKSVVLSFISEHTHKRVIGSLCVSRFNS